MDDLNSILELIEEKICEKIDVLIKRNYCSCKSEGDTEIKEESGFEEFDGYMYYSIFEHSNILKQLKDKNEPILICWNVGAKNNLTQFCESICDTMKSLKYIKTWYDSNENKLMMSISKY